MYDDHPSTTDPQDVQFGGSLDETPTRNSTTSTPVCQSVDDGSSNQQSSESDKQPKPPKPSVPLRRSVYMVYLTLLYAAAALYAWVIICIETYRPIGGKGYGFEVVESIPQYTIGLGYLDENIANINALFARSERHLRAARIVQSVVSVLTIPLTSAVCSQAAVVYIQRRRRWNRPTLRQTMALADKGWTDIMLLIKLFCGGWTKYSSSFLLFALFLNLLGAAIGPVQQIFLSFQTIKRVESPMDATLPSLTSFIDMSTANNDNEDVARLRASMASTTLTDIQPRLWSSSNTTISLDDQLQHGDSAYSPFETMSQNTLANISTIIDPFWSELPTGTNTGLLREFAPRINSTVMWENNSALVLPEDCNPSSDAFYLKYQTNDTLSYTIEICMPGNMSQSPWKWQMDRQDFTEELYLRMNFSGDWNTWHMEYYGGLFAIGPGVYSRKLTLTTTTGYFEIPNYKIGQVPGPFIGQNPYGNSTNSTEISARDVDPDAQRLLNLTINASRVGTKGPLLNIAMALFGEGSLLDVQHTVLAAYAKSDIVYGGCIDIVPVSPLLRQAPWLESYPLLNCLRGVYLDEQPSTTLHIVAAYYGWIFSTAPPSEVMQNEFAVAAFLAIDISMTNDDITRKGIEVSYNMGVDIQIPHISQAGIIFISILLGIDLICLLALAIYSAWIPRWTGKLDSFAMLRIGASISDRIPLLATQHVERIKTLDETPGWIGNASDGNIGELCLGAEQPLKTTKLYLSYETDQVTQTTATKKVPGPIRREGYSLAQMEVPSLETR